VIATLASAGLAVGAFLLEHADLIEDVAEALKSGTPKDAIRAAIRGAIVKTSDDAIREELEAAESRK
jgi:hypothetical protein